jgi:hypothetical protein
MGRHPELVSGSPPWIDRDAEPILKRVQPMVQYDRNWLKSVAKNSKIFIVRIFLG